MNKQLLVLGFLFASFTIIGAEPRGSYYANRQMGISDECKKLCPRECGDPFNGLQGCIICCALLMPESGEWLQPQARNNQANRQGRE